MFVTVDTKLVPLLGNPLAHSFSSRMQNAAYAAMGFDGFYFPIEVPNEHLGEIVSALRRMNVAGFAITAPAKVEILQYLDTLDPLAAQMGACNTVVNTNGLLKGYNTDGAGVIASLLQNQVDISSSVFFAFGAGGSAKAACYALAAKGAKTLIIASRSDSSSHLAAELNATYGPIAVPCRVSDENTLEDMIRSSDVLLNFSGVGMAPNGHETWIDKSLLTHRPTCFDATYNPPKTQFLLDAENMGCQIINGTGMLIHQGALQIELWTGRPAPYAVMEAAINDILSEH
ncbi:MAG: shikimate dehydrogenase [Oscillospiraceae bacterium]|nr:shikimate dehydrogenase [Oscillospiraceae bacterium]